jgi:hypothetical protein
MRCLQSLAVGLALFFAIGFLQGCGERRTEVGGVTPEFRKADLASQDAMRQAMQSQKPKGRVKGKTR